MSEKTLLDLLGGTTEEKTTEEIVEVEETEEAIEKATEKTAKVKEETGNIEMTSLLTKEEIIKTSTKTPVFQYADIKEELQDLKITIEDLRKKYEKDFPELERKDRVSYTIDYGFTKFITTTETDQKKKIEDVKKEMEGDKKFTDALKKAKNPLQMVIKARVTGQTKGNIYNEFDEMVDEVGYSKMGRKINSFVKNAIEEAKNENGYSPLQVKKLKSEMNYFALKLWEFYNSNAQNNIEGNSYQYSEEMGIDDTEYLQELLFRQILKLPPLRILNNNAYKYYYYPKNIA